MSYEKQSSNISGYDYFQPIMSSPHVCDKNCTESCIKKYFSKENIDKISHKITELLQGVDIKNRRIIVPNDTIVSVMRSVYKNFVPENIQIIRDKEPNNIQIITDKVINIITKDVKYNLGIEQNNSKLTIWNSILGDFNSHGLNNHPPLKLKENTYHDNKMEFMMMY